MILPCAYCGAINNIEIYPHVCPNCKEELNFTLSGFTTIDDLLRFAFAGGSAIIKCYKKDNDKVTLEINLVTVKGTQKTYLCSWDKNNKMRIEG